MKLVDQAVEFKFESNLEPLSVIWQSLSKAIKFQTEKTVQGFECKIDGRALGAALRHSLGGSDGQAQTQDVSESAPVAAGRDRLTFL